MAKTALFAGSFDPYTVGHHALVERALQMFDKVVVAIGYNSEKGVSSAVEERVAAIAAVYSGDSRVEVRSYTGLTMDFAREVGADVLASDGYVAFEKEQERWLKPYALFRFLSSRLHSNIWDWGEYSRYDSTTTERVVAEYPDAVNEMRFHCYVQY